MNAVIHKVVNMACRSGQQAKPTKDEAMTILASLAFLVAACVAVGAIAGTVLRYRESVLSDLAGYRSIAADRDFHFRVYEFGRQPVATFNSNVRRIGKRIPVQRSIKPAGWRAAA